MGEVKLTTIKLQLVDTSYTFSRDEVENVLVKVNKFILLANFVVLDMEEDEDVPIIMGRPFSAIGHSIIDVAARELIARVFNESMVIKVFDASEYLDDIMTCLEDE